MIACKIDVFMNFPQSDIYTITSNFCVQQEKNRENFLGLFAMP